MALHPERSFASRHYQHETHGHDLFARPSPFEKLQMNMNRLEQT